VVARTDRGIDGWRRLFPWTRPEPGVYQLSEATHETIDASHPLPEPDLNAAVDARDNYARALLLSVVYMTVMGLLVAALAFRWVPTAPEFKFEPIFLPPTLTATALSALAAIVIALQVAARQPLGAARVEEHLGRVSIIGGIAGVAGIGAIVLVSGDLMRQATDNPYAFLITFEFCAGLLVAAVAADAGRVIESRHVAEMQRIGRREDVSKFQQAIDRVSAHPVANRRKYYVLDSVALATSVVLAAVVAAILLERLSLRSLSILTITLAGLTVVTFLTWTIVRADFLISSRVSAFFGAAAYLLAITLFVSGFFAKMAKVGGSSTAFREILASVLVFSIPLYAASWAHRPTSENVTCLGDWLVLQFLRIQKPNLDRTRRQIAIPWRGWLSLLVAFLVPLLGLLGALLVARAEGIKSSERDRHIAQWGWVAGLGGVLAEFGLFLYLWNTYA